MGTSELIFNIIAAIGSLATAGSFIYLLKGQKDSQKQIDSLTCMAKTFQRHYEMERIKAGEELYPKIDVAIKHDMLYGMKILVRNNSYPISIYRIIINSGQSYCDIHMQCRKDYIEIKQGETKPILPGYYSCGSLYCEDASIRVFFITPFDEAFEIRFSSSDAQHCYQSQPIIKTFSSEEHSYENSGNIKINSYEIHGGIKGTVEDNFPEIKKETENEILD